MGPLALDLDVLGDVHALWRAWLEDVERRLGVSEAELDSVGNWRTLLVRFAEENAPVHLRRDGEVAAHVRRLHAAGARIGVFSELPPELVRVALAHLGAGDRIESVGTLDEVSAALGPDARIVRSRDQLAALQ